MNFLIFISTKVQRHWVHEGRLDQYTYHATGLEFIMQHMTQTYICIKLSFYSAIWFFSILDFSKKLSNIFFRLFFITTLLVCCTLSRQISIHKCVHLNKSNLFNGISNGSKRKSFNMKNTIEWCNVCAKICEYLKKNVDNFPIENLKLNRLSLKQILLEIRFHILPKEIFSLE